MIPFTPHNQAFPLAENRVVTPRVRPPFPRSLPSSDVRNNGYFKPENQRFLETWRVPLLVTLFILASSLILIVLLPTHAMAAEQNNFQFVCANGAVAQIRSDGSIELVDESKLERQKDRAKSILTRANQTANYKDAQISEWELKHIERKLRATQKQKGACRKIAQ